MYEYATLSPHQNKISRLVGASVFFTSNGAMVKDGIYQRGLNRSFGCFTRGHGCYHPVRQTNSFHRSGSFRYTSSLYRTVRIASDFETRSYVQIFQIGERELIDANWKSKEESYLAKSPATGNRTPLCIRME